MGVFAGLSSSEPTITETGICFFTLGNTTSMFLTEKAAAADDLENLPAKFKCRS
jgi:hypothetical protein